MHLLFTIFGIALCLLTLPLVLELAGLTAAALLFRAEDDLPPSHLRIAVVIAAHNEEKLIARTIASVQGAGGGENIHVIAHNCSDKTAEIIRASGANVFELNGPRGKGHALLHAFTALRAEKIPPDAFLVLDADTTIAPDLLERVRAALTLHSAVQCRYEAAAGASNQLAALAFRAINVVRPRGREKLNLSCGIFGNGFAFRTTVLDRVPYNAHSIVEDIEFHVMLVCENIRVHYLDKPRLYGEIAGSRSQHARWEGGRLQIARQQLPKILPQLLRGQLRLLEPALDLASLPQAQAIVLLLIALALPLMWLRVYAVLSLLTIAVHVLTAVALAPQPGRTFAALLLAPVYIVKKLLGTKATLRSADAQAAWQRADRDSQ